MHRLIMNSEAYRRSTETSRSPALLVEKDPGGTSYAVFQPRRLTAEELRGRHARRDRGIESRPWAGIPNRPEINLERPLSSRVR